MNQTRIQNRIILLLSLFLAALIIITSCVSLLTPGFYSAETLNWQAQSLGQDIIDLIFIAPSLLITSILASRTNRKATMIWGGIVLYLTYTFALYCFDVHFNKLFILYCLCLGLSFYSFMYFLFTQYKQDRLDFENKKITRFVGIYFIIISVLFYFLWLSEIIPAIIQHITPKSVAEAGLFTNGVHVIDLAVILPAIFITGIFLLKRISFGTILAPVILTFFVLMDITIAALSLIMKIKGVKSDLTLTFIMSALTLLSAGLLILFLKTIHSKINQ
jgi:hypothetical protein